MKHLIFSIGLAIALTGCLLNSYEKIREQCDNSRGYCFDFHTVMNGRLWTDNWTDTVGETTDHTLSNGLNASDENYIRADITSYAKCPLTTRHMPTILNTKYGKWGKVVFNYTWDATPGENNVFCRNLELPQKSSAYAFCAEKDGKAVAICIQQMTDDEDLAHLIFESFRWTD